MKQYLIFIVLSLASVHGFSQENLKPLDKNLNAVNYPFPVSFFHWVSQKEALEMAYMDINATEPNGKSVLLLHGKNFNSAYWETTVKALTQEGYRVIVPDQIGFGKSTKPSNYQYSFHQLAANTKAILDSLQINKINVVGHSMGGMLATRFALMYPELTEKLVLVNPIGLEDYKTLTPYQPIDTAYLSELKNTVETYREYEKKSYYDNKWKPEYDRWLNLLAGFTLHRDYPIVAWNAALTSDMVYTQPVVYEFKNIKCPTLLIIGTRDRTAIGKDRASKEMQPKMGLYNELGRKTHEAIPNSQLVELENVGHLPHIEAFGRFIQPLLAFLRN